MLIHRKYRWMAMALLGVTLLLSSEVGYCQETGSLTGKSKSNLTGSSSTAPKPGTFANINKMPVFSSEKNASTSSDFGKTMIPDSPPPFITDAVPYPISMEFYLEWTQCQIHRVRTDSAIVMILSGAISSTNAIYWNLANTAPGHRTPNALCYDEDIFGRVGPAYGRDIPLTWEISLDYGQYAPILVQPDSSLMVLFPAGDHKFQLRITALPQYHESDGHYNLQLNQSLAPQL